MTSMEKLLHDVRYAVRTLLRTPGWTTMAVLTLALGTGANAAVFSFVDALLFKAAPGVRPKAPLVSVYTSDFSSGPYGESSYPDYVAFKTGTTAFGMLAAIDDAATATVRIGDDLQRVRVAHVTGEYFSALGVAPVLGRTLFEADMQPGAPPAAVIGDGLWRRAFGGDPAAVGTTITLSGRTASQTLTIVGIAPRRFTGIDAGRPIEVWTPLMPGADPGRGNRGFRVIGQLRGGVSMSEARAQLSALAATLAREFPDTNLGTLDRPKEPRPFFVIPASRINPQQREQVAMVASVLMGGVGLVLLLACANVASLMLSRTTTRAREIAVRRALGATGRRLLRQLLTETAVLAFTSTGLAMIFAAWTADVLPSFFPPEQAAALDVSPGLRVAAFALALSAVSAFLVGIVPALRAVRAPLAASLRGATGDITERTGSRARTVLVVAQISIACVLLVAAALLVQSVSNQLNADFGFSTRQALMATVEIPATLGEQKGQAFYREARARVASLTGVEDVAWVRTLPLSGGARRGFKPEGYVPREGEDLELNYNVVSPEYFRTLGIAVVGGRTFTSMDDAPGDRTKRVVVVNEILSKRFFNGDAVGRTLTDSSGAELEIVGVVRSGKYRTVTEDAPPIVFYPLGQSYFSRMSIVVRGGSNPERYAERLRREIRALSGDVPVFRVVTLQSHVEEALSAERLSASLVSACGVLSALLAIVGLYGAVAYLVTRRTREIGVRVALGAQPRHVIALVVRHGLELTVIGIAIGLVCAAGFATLIRSMLYGISPASPLTHLSVALTLTAVAALAAYVPARRAVRIDPARALASL